MMNFKILKRMKKWTKVKINYKTQNSLYGTYSKVFKHSLPTSYMLRSSAEVFFTTENY